MTAQRSLIAPTAHARLETALHQKLQRRGAAAGSLGELEPLAVRLGLIQNTLKPRLASPQLLVFAGDHGLVVDGLARPGQSTLAQVKDLLAGRVPLAVLAFIHGINLTVVDAGLSDQVGAHPALLQRKIGFGTRNTRVAQAMTVDQAHAAVRAGMEIADTLPGNALACAGLGVGSHFSAALLIARLAGLPLERFIDPSAPAGGTAQLGLLDAMQARHPQASDPVEVVAAFGGYEIAMMVGAMLVAASKRHVVIVDGLPACAALLVASRIAAAVTDYVVFSRSHGGRALDATLALFQASALLELGMNSADGTGAALAWPLITSAAALLTEVADGEDTGPSQAPSTLTPEFTVGGDMRPPPSTRS